MFGKGSSALIVNMQESKLDLSRPLDEAAGGTPLTCGQERKPVRRLGFMGGECSVPDDFDLSDPKEIETLFYGE